MGLWEFKVLVLGYGSSEDKMSPARCLAASDVGIGKKT